MTVNKRLLLLITCVCTLFSINVEAGPKKKVHTIGDSTMAEYATDGSTDMRGWGQMLQQFLNPDNAIVNNRGKNGASSKSFYKEAGYWNTLVKGGVDEMNAGDFLLIQFAHNDEKCGGVDGEELKKYYIRQGAVSRTKNVDYRATNTFDTFKEYMRSYINEAKAMGVKPIVVGPICRNYFNNDGSKITRSGRHDLGDEYSIIKDGVYLEGQNVGPNDHTYDYAESAKEVAAEFDDVPYIDLTSITASMYEKYGYMFCKNRVFCSADKTHTAAFGATAIARAFALQLKKQAEEETDAKKKAVLQEIAADVTVGEGITFVPSDGDMGLAYVGSELAKPFTVAAFDMSNESGNVNIKADNGFQLSLDKVTWKESVDLKFSNSVLMNTIYVRANTTQAGVVRCKLTATDGTITSVQNVKVENLQKGVGTEAYATWELSSNTDAKVNMLAAEMKLSEMFVESFQMAPIVPNGHAKMVLFNIEGGSWPSSDGNEVASRYIEFKAVIPKGKILNLTDITLDVCGFGGNNTCYRVYYATKGDFSDRVLLAEGYKTAKEHSATIEKEILRKIGEGQSVYVRIYPSLKGNDRVSGKCIGVSDVNIKGILADAPPAPVASKTNRGGQRSAAKPAANKPGAGAGAKKPTPAVKKK